MPDDPHGRLTPGAGAPLEGRLDSWKEIAAYLGRGIRTVQRWERDEGLPVHRLVHEKRGSIYARREELAAWWESRRRTLLASSTAGREVMPIAPVAPRLERVTWTSAMTSWPALSSDARLIAYVSDAGQDGTTPQIWIQQLGGAALRLTNGEREYSHLSFAPDDTRIIFTAGDEEGQQIYEVPTLGGEPRLLQRGASRGRISPDGKWLASVPNNAVGIRFTARDGGGCRTAGAELVDVTCATWAPDSRAVLVHARPDPAFDSDWWIVPLDGGARTNTGLIRRFREAGMFTLPMAPAWADDALLFSAAGTRVKGVRLFRQRIVPSTFEPKGALEQLTTGNESALLPNAAAGRLAFLSIGADANIWSVPIDAVTGVAHGPLLRMTRGSNPLGYMSVTNDFRTLAYFSYRLGRGDIFLRDLQTGSEKVLGEGPDSEKSYPAISPSGNLLAYGTVTSGGERVSRPIFIAGVTNGRWRTLGEDCGGRPREWVDERWLVIERFARLNSIALIETDTGEQRELLASAERSIRNPRLSPDRRWMAFEASSPGELASVCVTPLRDAPIPEAEWVTVERSATHPFWSADGRFLYYTPTGTNPMIRSAVRARPIGPDGPVAGAPLAVFSSNDMMMPAYIGGTTPIATPDHLLLVLGDFRGDVWMMDLD